MTEPFIQINGLSKKYSIAAQQNIHATMRDKIADILKRPFAFLGRKKEGQGSASKEDFWALKDISFSVQKGEVIGIIGKNGSGKSTLLKILSRITQPTEGTAHIHGKVSSLLEVGTGFHPELSGRENIYLNGSILGMNRKDIDAKFQRIVDFSGIEKFLDTPVKKYSSGMKMRLAFSVAAHLDAEILLIDEVLAVGDAEFQKKCLSFMDEATQKDGRTIIFVSHNLAAIERLCPKTILLDKGRIVMMGNTDEIISFYSSKEAKRYDGDLGHAKERTGAGRVKFSKFEIFSESGESTWEIGVFSSPTFRFDLSSEEPVGDLRLKIEISDTAGAKMVLLNSTDLPIQGSVSCKIKNINLVPGKYFITFSLYQEERLEDHLHEFTFFKIVSGSEPYHGSSKVQLGQEWTIG